MDPSVSKLVLGETGGSQKLSPQKSHFLLHLFSIDHTDIVSIPSQTASYT